MYVFKVQNILLIISVFLIVFITSCSNISINLSNSSVNPTLSMQVDPGIAQAMVKVNVTGLDQVSEGDKMNRAYIDLLVDGKKNQVPLSFNKLRLLNLFQGKHTIEGVLFKDGNMLMNGKGNPVTFKQTFNIDNGITFSVSAKPTTDGAILHFNTKNFTISSEHIDEKSRQGFGHVHLIVDNGLLSLAATSNNYKISGLSKGKHRVQIELADDTHFPIQVQQTISLNVL